MRDGKGYSWVWVGKESKRERGYLNGGEELLRFDTVTKWRSESPSEPWPCSERWSPLFSYRSTEKLEYSTLNWRKGLPSVKQTKSNNKVTKRDTRSKVCNVVEENTKRRVRQKVTSEWHDYMGCSIRTIYT